MGKSDGTSCTDLAHQLLSATFPALFATLACRPPPRSRGNTSRASGTIAAPTPSSLLPRTDCAPLHRLWPAHLMNQSLAKKSIEEKLVGRVVSVSGGRSSAGQGGDRPAVHGIWDQRRERRGGRVREERARRRRQRDASTGPRPPAGECIHSTAAVCHALAATPLQPAITTTLPPAPCCLLPQPLTLIHIRLRQVSAHAARLGQQSRQDADCTAAAGRRSRQGSVSGGCYGCRRRRRRTIAAHTAPPATQHASSPAPTPACQTIARQTDSQTARKQAAHHPPPGRPPAVMSMPRAACAATTMGSLAAPSMVMRSCSSFRVTARCAASCKRRRRSAHGAGAGAGSYMPGAAAGTAAPHGHEKRRRRRRVRRRVSSSSSSSSSSSPSSPSGDGGGGGGGERSSPLMSTRSTRSIASSVSPTFSTAGREMERERERGRVSRGQCFICCGRAGNTMQQAGWQVCIGY